MKDTCLISKNSGTLLISDMGGYYPEHQERVHVETTLTSNMLLHAKKEGLLHPVTTD